MNWPTEGPINVIVPIPLDVMPRMPAWPWPTSVGAVGETTLEFALGPASVPVLGGIPLLRSSVKNGGSSIVTLRRAFALSLAPDADLRVLRVHHVEGPHRRTSGVPQAGAGE